MIPFCVHFQVNGINVEKATHEEVVSYVSFIFKRFYSFNSVWISLYLVTTGYSLAVAKLVNIVVS